MRACLTAAIGVFAFLLSCAVLHRVLPSPETDIVSPKLRQFARHKDEFNTIFLGSSHIQHQLSPATFDRTTGQAGLQTRSFNFGVNGMHIPESGYVLECLAKSKPANLRWVFLELDEIQVGRLQEQVGTRRAVYWHDRKRTALALQRVLEAGPDGRWLSPKTVRDLIIPRKNKERAQRKDLFYYHLGLFLRNFANLGRGLDATERFSDSQNEEKGELGTAGDGYMPLRRQMSARQTSAYETELAKEISEERPRIVSLQTEEACRESAAVVRKLGAIPVFLVTPVTRQSEFRFRRAPGAVLSFNDAKHYPSFYRPEARLDLGHLNASAAPEFSRDVAQKFARLVQENQIR